VRQADLVSVKYRDHLLFRHSDASKQTPRIVTAVGRLAHDDADSITLIWEDYTDPGDRVVKSTGLCIIKGDIVELRRLTDG
jgi:hypothetical protein